MKKHRRRSRHNSSHLRNTNYSINTRIILFSAALIIFIDQISKVIVRSGISQGEFISVLGSFFGLTHQKNTGIAFSLLSGAVWVPVWLSIIALGIILIFHDKVRNRAEACFLGLVIGGIIGNLIDRMVFGAVTDFIAFSFWPAFNIADSALTVGGIGLAVSLFYLYRNDLNDFSEKRE